MAKTFCAVLIAASFWTLAARADSPPDTPPEIHPDIHPDIHWISIGREDDISLFRQEIPGSDVFAFKGEGYVDAPLEKVASFMADPLHSKDWIENLKSSRIIQVISPLEHIEYNQIRMPLFVTDRDLVLDVKVEVFKENQELVTHLKSVDRPDIHDCGDCVRGELIDSSFVLKAAGPDRTFLVATIHADPKGSIAKWIVNNVQHDWAKYTIKRIRRQMKRTDIQILPEYQNIFK
jgi:hypothetical protein